MVGLDINGAANHVLLFWVLIVMLIDWGEFICKINVGHQANTLLSSLFFTQRMDPKGGSRLFITREYILKVQISGSYVQYFILLPLLRPKASPPSAVIGCSALISFTWCLLTCPSLSFLCLPVYCPYLSVCFFPVSPVCPPVCFLDLPLACFWLQLLLGFIFFSWICLILTLTWLNT